MMKVQRVRLPDTDRITWLVLDDEHMPIQPVLSYLKFLGNLNRSPNTVRSAAHHLKLYWEYLRDARLEWTEIDIAQLAEFISWLRRDNPNMVSIEHRSARRTDATIDQILGTVHGLYTYHLRVGTVRELPLWQLSMPSRRQYKPFLHGIVKTRPEQTRVVSLKRERRLPKTLTSEQIQQLLDACTHIRDQLLLAFLHQTGMRIGQVLGLKHADISVENAAIEIVPRDDNPNGARAKTRVSHTIPAMPDLLHLYTTYLIDELCALEIDALPDFVFINLWEDPIGRPMTYAGVMSLVKRLSKKTGVVFSPHMLRHSRATSWIRDDKLPLPVVSRLLTHASIATTNDTYLHLDHEDLRKALAEGKEEQRGCDSHD